MLMTLSGSSCSPVEIAFHTSHRSCRKTCRSRPGWKKGKKVKGDVAYSVRRNKAQNRQCFSPKQILQFSDVAIFYIMKLKTRRCRQLSRLRASPHVFGPRFPPSHLTSGLHPDPTGGVSVQVRELWTTPSLRHVLTYCGSAPLAPQA